jgi:uncharacterized OB-fold protein
MSEFVLADGIYPVASAETDLDRPFWDGTREEEIRIQRCRDCRAFQWGPELVCSSCHSFDLGFEAVAPTGTVYSWTRVWHASHPALVEHVPYVVLVVELDHAPGIRLIGNRIGDQLAPVEIGTPVSAVFEHHQDYTLVQWREQVRPHTG